MLRAYVRGTLWKSKGVGSYMCPTLALCAGEGHTPSHWSSVKDFKSLFQSRLLNDLNNFIN